MSLSSLLLFVYLAFSRLAPSTSARLLDGGNIQTATNSLLTRQHRRDLKIAYGHEPPKDSARFPYAATIAFEDGNRENKIGLCTGVLIHPRWLLTAASCIEAAGDRAFIHIGDSRVRPNELLVQKGQRLVEAHYIHYSFSGNLADGANIGLLYLSEAQNVSLPKLPQDQSSLAYGLKLVGLGRGLTEINHYFSESLRVASSFKYFEPEICAKLWHKTSNITLDLGEDVICVSGQLYDNTQGLCKGDEGGPLLQVDPTSYDLESASRIVAGDPLKDTVYGIGSFGPEHCGLDGFSMYTSIFHHIAWINDIIESHESSTLSKTPPQNDEKLEAEGRGTERIKIWLIVSLSVCGILVGGLLCFAISWWKKLDYLCLRSERERSSSSNKVQRLKIRNGDQPSLFHVSPFLASPRRDSGTDSSTSFANGAQAAAPLESLPGDRFVLDTNISVTLVGRKIGSGAFGHVEEGIHVDSEGIHHSVAVKTVNAESDDLGSCLKNEMSIFKRVGQHPNIVHCYGGNFRKDPSKYYIVQELMDYDLGEYFKNPNHREKTTFETFLQVFYGIAHGLQHLHDSEVIHFDLKPGNILLDGDRHPKLADFGCSRKRARTYITAGARGTMSYMAPELWLLGMYVKKAQVRAEKLDVFSYGVVMWEIFTNQTPLDPLNVQQRLLIDDMHPEIEAHDESTMEHVEGQTNDDFRRNRFSFTRKQCPMELRNLMWECLSYYNYLRPSVPEIKERLWDMLQSSDWRFQYIDEFQHPDRANEE